MQICGLTSESKACGLGQISVVRVVWGQRPPLADAPACRPPRAGSAGLHHTSTRLLLGRCHPLLVLGRQGMPRRRWRPMGSPPMAMHLWLGPGGLPTSRCQEPTHPQVSCMLLVLHMQLLAQLTATEHSLQAGTACGAGPSHRSSPGHALLAAAAACTHAPAAADVAGRVWHCPTCAVLHVPAGTARASCDSAAPAPRSCSPCGASQQPRLHTVPQKSSC